MMKYGLSNTAIKESDLFRKLDMEAILETLKHILRNDS